MPWNYSGNPNAIQNPSPAPSSGGAPVVSQPVGTDTMSAASVWQPPRTVADYLIYCALRMLPGIFGDGSDGSAVLDGTATVPWATLSGGVYTQTRDVFAINLSVVNGATLKTNGYRVYGTGTLTTSGGGNLGNDGDAGINGAGDGGDDAGAPSNTIGGGANGGGEASTNNNGNPGSGSTNSLGGNGGAGGNAPIHTGGAGGAVSFPSPPTDNMYHLASSPAMLGWVFDTNTATWIKIKGGAGGGSGGRDTTGNAGGGGGGGGVVMLAFRSIVLASVTDVHVLGGKGGDGDRFSGSAAASGGGGGGVILVAYGTCNRVLTAAVNCAGGAGGSKVGTGCQDGSAGGSGNVVNLVLGA